MKRLGLRFFPLVCALAFAPATATLAGCGHSDEEMAAKQRDIDSLKARLKAADDRHTKDDADYQTALKQIEDLKSKMRDAGLAYEDKLGRSEKEKADLAQALDEYKQRAAQLDAMKKRFQDLKARLDKLTSVGLKVVTRNNRMVIQLPGDILFDSGVDILKNDGKKVLKQIADVINGDDTLKLRNFQVAGHTDNQEYGNGPFRDNWGLSVARARSVVVFLVAKDEPPKGQPPRKDGVPYGGNLDPKNWSAAGYGIMDPIAGSVAQQSVDDMKKNRRVELVLQPNVEEMLNLKDFGN